MKRITLRPMSPASFLVTFGTGLDFLGHALACVLACGLAFGIVCAAAQNPPQDSGNVLRGQGTVDDWNNQRPGNRHLVTPGDLPKPDATPSATNFPRVMSRPSDAWPKVPEGFKVELVATGLDNPRAIATAPNGDLFFAESEPGRIRVIHGIAADGKAESNQVFASGLAEPYGIAFYPLGANPQYVYVANTNSVVRFPYQNGDLKARGPAQIVVAHLPYGGAHWTRDIGFFKRRQKDVYRRGLG